MFLCLFLQNKRHMPGYFNDEKPALVVVFTARGLLHLPVLAFYLRGILECTVMSSTDSLKNMKPENAPTFGKEKCCCCCNDEQSRYANHSRKLTDVSRGDRPHVIYIYKCIYLDLEMNDPRVG